MKRVRTHTNPLNMIHRFDTVDLNSIMNNTDGCDVEIGFGKGVFLRYWASEHPKRTLLGIEVRKQIVDQLQRNLHKENIENAHIFHGNGTIFMEDALPDKSIDNLFIFHPDPWFKKRHHKRRVVNQSFLSLAQQKLKADGQLHLSTDVEALWEDMVESISVSTAFKKEKDHPFWNTHYKSHWHNFSKKDNRVLNYATFTLS
ncbi:tRNA (guanosine(46)-N7)-methyltransferase TrmB [Candidatus Marinamargulisbacteria bacterium SCGC AG-343-D04]|nr:tRNA (guanosine(46)-N7)-methyltransferase TrmB [Candidatus Marinamargulisbacteria bacterium SCGC AG-343-D04]